MFEANNTRCALGAASAGGERVGSSPAASGSLFTGASLVRRTGAGGAARVLSGGAGEVTGSELTALATFSLLRRMYTEVGRGSLPGGARGARGADGDAARPERDSSSAPSGRGALPKVQLYVPRRSVRSNSGPGSGDDSRGASSPRPVRAFPNVAGVRS